MPHGPTNDLGELWEYCTKHFLLGNSLHGPAHWRRVEEFGLAIAKTSGADPHFVRLFAVLHDSCRQNEGHDPEHGLRASKLAKKLRRKLFVMEDLQFEKLEFCLMFHDKGKTSDDVEIGTCWDADRLDLPRVGITPKDSYLSTEAAKVLRKSLCGRW